MRRTSLPLTTHHIQKDDTALTVPLRACCPDCVPITEESLKEGEEWQEKFSRGARRRRSASLDNSDSFLSSSPTTPRQLSRGFTAVTVNPSAPAVVISCTSPRYNKTSNFAITVDEVDKRRKSQEFEEDIKRLRQPYSSSPRSSPTFHSPNAPFSSAPHSPIYRPHEKDTSTSSTSSSISTSSEPNTPDYPPRRPKSSPIQEEDEDQLFPLPSPRRTPTSSPSPSMNASPSPSPSPSVKASPAPSPNASTSCLAPPSGLSASRESLPRTSPGGEGMLSRSLSRKSPHHDSEFAAQQASTTISPSPLSPPGTSKRSTSTQSSKPQPSPLLISERARATSGPVLSASPAQYSPQLSGVDTASPLTPGKAYPLPIPPSSSSAQRRPSAAKSASPPPPSTFPAMSTSPSSKSPPQSPVSPGKQRRPSFSLPYLKDALKGAGADVLRGVSSMGGGGAVGAV